MQKKLKRRTVVFGLVLIPLFILSALTINAQNKTQKSFSLISPLPALFTNSSPQVLASQSYWIPIIRDITAAEHPRPEITAKAAVSYDLTTDSLIYSKNIKQRLPIASITKIMTALTAIEHESLDKKITVSKRAAEIGENSMGLEAGEVHTLNDLLYGLILPSGNDAAEVIAEGSEFGRDNFIYMMNKTAEDLGLADTRFTNPSGLEGDGDQYSTPYDLLVLTRYALQNETFADVVSTYEHLIPESENHKPYYLYNDTNLLTTYPGVKGVKTGFTNEAGMCLVTYLEYKDHKIIAVLLNSDNRREEMKQLLDYSLLSLGVEPPSHP